MQNLNREKIQQAFQKYTKAYNSENPKIKLKIDHTYRVATLAEKIALTVDDVDSDMAWVLGMLHDIGRFEQIKRYNTFSDADSIDHAELGADLLFKENLLSTFGVFSEEEKEIIEVSIRNHSRYRIQENLSESLQNYCHILRDADKIDIFRVNCETPLEDIYNVTTEELSYAEVSEAVKQCFHEKHAVLRKLKETAVDNLVAHICLIYELVYPISPEIAKEQGYIDKLLAFQSKNVETQKWFAYMRSVL